MLLQLSSKKYLNTNVPFDGIGLEIDARNSVRKFSGYLIKKTIGKILS